MPSTVHVHTGRHRSGAGFVSKFPRTHRDTKPKKLPEWDAAGASGCLTPDMLGIIHHDDRLRRAGSRPWEKAPTPEKADRNAKAAAKRLGHRNYAKIAGTASLSSIISSCRNTAPCGSHACFRCGQLDQRWLVSAMAPVLATFNHGYRDWAFNFVMPEGQTPIKALTNAPFQLLIGRIRRALLDCPEVLFAVFAIDTSANDDTAKFLGGRLRKGMKRYFQAHVYGIVRARNREAVWQALRGLFATAPNIYRPLWVSEKKFDGTAKGVSYVLKPQGFRRIAYRNDEGHWKTRKPEPALKPLEHVYYLLATHKLGFAHRISFVGLHPIITKATDTTPATVTLRRVCRSRGSK